MRPTYAFGDVHGHVDQLAARLHEARLVDDEACWCGDDAALWLTGDLVDRGPFGIEAIDLVMRLEAQAEQAGGAVCALLGNHDLLLLGVARFGDFTTESPRASLRADWVANGGRERDLIELGHEQIEWLARRPAMGREGSTLLVHCDSTLYLELGASSEQANQRVAEILAGNDTAAWAELDDRLWRRNELWDPTIAREFVSAFGCKRVVHGHTPIPVVTENDLADVTEPHVYADGVYVNVDGGLYMGGPGFLVSLDEGP